MGSRGRASAAGLTVISGSGIEHIRRPPPPSHLSKEAAEEWKAIVNRMPPDWFPRETHTLLVQLCRLKVRADVVAKLLEGKKKLNLREFQSLLKTEQSLSGAITRIATKMRITQQSMYDKRKRRDHTPKGQPWEDETADEDGADEG